MIGENIRKIRTARGIGLRELARRSGVGLATLARIEAGQADTKLSTLERIAAALGVSAADLLAPAERIEAGEVAREHEPGLEVYAWTGVEEVAGRRFIVVWEPGREIGRVYAALEDRPVAELIHDAVGAELEELPAELTVRTPFLRRWGGGPFFANRPPKELYAAVAREAELELMPLVGEEEVKGVWGKKVPPGRL